MSSLAGLLVAAATLLNIGGCLWLLWWTRKRRDEGTQTPRTTGHVWDGDLTEYNNPLPRWWLGAFLITVAFGLVYLAIYPGLGNFTGVRGWTQLDQYRAESTQVEAALAKTFAPFEQPTVADLAHDPQALRVGRNLFLNNCAACHGSDGRGAPGFPNLADHDWLWGGEPDTVLESIRNGRDGMMMAWREVLGEQGVDNALAYVMSLSGSVAPMGNVALGREKFTEICSACHGVDAHGNKLIGAPDLTDHIWLNGGSAAAVRESIANGRHGQMPAHLERLGPVRTKLLAAYVLSLGSAPH